MSAALLFFWLAYPILQKLRVFVLNAASRFVLKTHEYRSILAWQGSYSQLL